MLLEIFKVTRVEFILFLSSQKQGKISWDNIAAHMVKVKVVEYDVR